MAELKIEKRLNFVDLILTRQVLFWSSVVRMFKQGVTFNKARQGILQEKYTECLLSGKSNLYYETANIQNGEIGPQLKDTRIEAGGFPFWLAVLIYLLFRYYLKRSKKKKL